MVTGIGDITTGANGEGTLNIDLYPASISLTIGSIGVSGTGLGAVNVNTGIISVTGAVYANAITVGNDGTLNVTSVTSASTITISGEATFTGVVTATGLTTVNGTATFEGTTNDLAGLTIAGSGDVTFGGGTTGAVTNAGILSTSGTTTIASLNNTGGTLDVTGAGSTTTITAAITSGQGGTINITGGVLDARGSLNAVAVGTGATLNLTAGDPSTIASLTGAGSITTAADVSLTITNTGTGGFTGAIETTGDDSSLTITNGTFGSTVTSGGTLNITNGTFNGLVKATDGDLTVSAGTFNAGLEVTDGDLIKNSAGTATVSGTIDIAATGEVIVDGGTLVILDDQDHSSVDYTVANGTLQIGNATTAANVTVDNWNGGGTLILGIADGGYSSLTIEGTVSGETNVKLDGTSANLNALGEGLLDGSFVDINLITADTGKTGDEFTMNYSSTKYKFFLEFDDDSTNSIWSLGAVKSFSIALPESSTMVAANILAFELPKSSFVNGPWFQFRGGQLNDGRSSFDKNSYQTVQVGWEQNFRPYNNNGCWNAGIFFEGDWLYGSGQNKMIDTANKVNSSAKGIGAGLYLGRMFRNQWYFDLAGRINQFENNARQVAFSDGYEASWNSRMFSMGLGVGKKFTSRDRRLEFNPYNRLLYNSAAANNIGILLEDGELVFARQSGYGAWTNRLGGRLAWNTYSRNRLNSQLFVGADYYQGLSGKFATTVDGTASAVGRSKNDMSYGVGTLGVTVLPTRNISLTFSGDGAFGDVDGYGLTFASKIMF